MENIKNVYPYENNFVLDEKSVEIKPFINIESQSNDLTIYLYSCDDINMKFLVVVTPPSIYHIYARVTEGIYGLSQAVRIAHGFLVKHLDPYGCHPSNKTPGLWIHKNQPINFTLVVDDFGVKYSVKENALLLKSVLEDKYTVTIYWEENIYIGITLNWDYEKVTVQFSIPGYVSAALHSL